MNLYDIPGMNGYKTALGSWGVMLTGFAGFLATVATFLTGLGALLSGDLTIPVFYQQSIPFFMSLGATFAGLMGLGIGHKIVKAQK